MIEDGTRIDGKDCILFKKRTHESNFVEIVNDNGCYSSVIFFLNEYFYFYLFCVLSKRLE
jgi:hypothetical protein